MPHIHVKIVGKTEEEKVTLSAAITQAIKEATGASEEYISVCIEGVDKTDWFEKVYRPDILGHWDNLYKKPGYDPLAK